MEAMKIHDISKRVINIEEIIKLTIELIALFKEENSYLEKFEVAKTSHIQVRKHEVADRLEFFRNAIIQNPELRNDIDKASLEILYNINTELNEVIAHNQYLLDRAIVTNGKVMELVREAIIDTQKENMLYNKQGVYNRNSKGKDDSMPPITIIEEI